MTTTTATERLNALTASNNAYDQAYDAVTRQGGSHKDAVRAGLAAQAPYEAEVIRARAADKSSRQSK